MVLLLVAVPLPAQRQPPSPDRMVAAWVEHGFSATWQPHHLFRGCPNLEEWQTRSIELLLEAELPRERIDDLARQWGAVLVVTCRDSRLEDWLFRQVDAAMQRGEPAAGLIPFWMVLQRADSPRIRDYLRNLMLDVNRPQGYRDAAGFTLFGRFGLDERMREYLSAFETRRLPVEMYWGQTDFLLERDPERLLREIGRRIRRNPDLADQGAFRQLVQSADRHASSKARHALAAELLEVTRRFPLTERLRYLLETSAERLKWEPPSVGTPR